MDHVWLKDGKVGSIMMLRINLDTMGFWGETTLSHLPFFLSRLVFRTAHSIPKQKLIAVTELGTIMVFESPLSKSQVPVLFLFSFPSIMYIV